MTGCASKCLVWVWGVTASTYFLLAFELYSLYSKDKKEIKLILLRISWPLTLQVTQEIPCICVLILDIHMLIYFNIFGE